MIKVKIIRGDNKGKTQTFDDAKAHRLIASNWAKPVEPEPSRPPSSDERAKAMADGPKHIGGGWYELPDGSKVQGKQALDDALGDDADND